VGDVRVWSACIVFVLAEGLVSYLEGTFTLARPHDMGFIDHGGMWSDVFLLPIANAVIVPCLPKPNRMRVLLYLGLLSVMLAATIWIHVQWMEAGWANGLPGFMFLSSSVQPWYLSVRIPGWMHVVFMALEMSLLWAYALSPMPRAVILTVSCILTLHVPVAIVQPGWYTTGRVWSVENLLPAMGVLTLTWIVAALKLRRHASSIRPIG
jgi:hypothetical protein